MSTRWVNERTARLNRQATDAARRLQEETDKFSASAIAWLLSTTPAPEILFVESDDALRHVVWERLQSAFPAILVRTSWSVEEAGEMVTLWNPAVVVMDLSEDLAPGAQVAACLPRVPHLLLTSRAIPQDQLEEVARRVRAVAIPYDSDVTTYSDRLVRAILDNYADAALSPGAPTA